MSLPTLCHPINNASAPLSSPHAIGDGALTFANASAFGSSFPIRVTATNAGQTVILLATASVSNVLTVSGAIEGTSDIALPSGTVVRALFTAGHLSDVHAYLADMVRPDAVTGFTAQQYVAQAALTDGATIAWDLNAQAAGTVTLAGNRALANPTNMAAGGTYSLIIIQDATGGRTLSFGTAYKWPGGTAPTLSTAANALDILTFLSDGTHMFGVSAKGFA